MDYTSLDTIPHYSDCSQMVSGIGYVLVDLKIVPQRGQYHVSAVITRNNSADNNIEDAIGINDCAKVHRLLLPRVEALLSSQDVYMEVTSPGMERNIKNAAEFALFSGRLARVWDTSVGDWVSGVIKSSDTQFVTLEISQEGTSAPSNETRTIPFAQIAKAKLLYI